MSSWTGNRRLRRCRELPIFWKKCQQAGIPMAVVTADETGAAIKHLSWLGLDHYFAEIIGTDQVERGKPFPDMVELACRRLGVNVAAAAVIGDSGGDMRMARSAGAAAAIGIASGETAGELPDADAIVASCGELELLV